MKRRLSSLLLIPFLLLYVFPAGAGAKEERKWQDEVIYYLMVDRFHNGDSANDTKKNNHDPSAYQGGDFSGVISKLDHIKDMGFTAVVLSPVFQNQPGGYHGYWITDFNQTNEQFGTKKELRKLVKEAHKKDLKVILDFPVTRVSTEHPWTKDSGKTEWFTNKKEQAPEKWLGQMATLNLENQAVKEELIRAVRKWGEEVEVDGYYFSDATDAPLSFWQEVTQQLKKRNKDWFLLGESREKDIHKLAEYEKTGLTGVMNAQLTAPLRKQFANVNKDSSQTPEVIKKTAAVLQNPLLSVNYFDSNKTERYTRDLVEEKKLPGTRWMLALTYLYTIPGIPAVYYGSEIALDGGEGVSNHQLLNFKTDQELMDYIKKLSSLRQELPALTRGDFELLYEKDGMVVFKRQYKKETIITAVNNTDKSQKVRIPAELLSGKDEKELRGLLQDSLVRPEGGQYTIILDRETSEVFALTGKTGINAAFIAALAAVYIIFLIFIFLVWKRGRNSRADRR
ncbi:alpha-amylase family glycosyl hydrolase [Bacillus xiapuensis]|uniref:alpha-amylase family glycosyl hydrolase n=1 Tax=Bacillus xiapuensis TaxID=2014075 RepID=UPI0018E20FC4|nr:alpha-amylase family glycosyl hydrolase [Bacillus xiapuensis]